MKSTGKLAAKSAAPAEQPTEKSGNPEKKPK
jgi:hypothetical protein